MRRSSQTDNNNNNLPRTWLGLKDAAREAYDQGHFEQALTLYQTALRPEYECVATSERQIILSNIVACRLQMRNQGNESAQVVVAAIRDAQQCVALNPRWSKGHVRLASAYSAAGRSNDACNSLQTALRLDPGNRTAREMLVRELRREQTTTSSTTPPVVVVDEDEDAPRPPPQNPNYIPPTNNNNHDNNSTNNTAPQGEGIQINMDDEGWTLQDRLRFYWMQISDWYKSQSNEVRTILLASLVFLIIYVTFGGRFGIGSGRTTQSTMKGNYGAGNAYEQFYRERQREATTNGHFDYYSNSNSQQRHKDYSSRPGYQENNYGGGSYEYRTERGGSYYPSGASWESTLPSIAMIGGIAYLCHLAGINPWHALLMMNAVGRRRRRFGGGFYGAGGFGRRRRRPGGFYW